MAPGKKKGVSNKVRKSTVGSRLGGSSSGVVTKTLGMRAMEQERARTSALVETQIAGLSERQAKLLEEGRNINLAEHDGHIIDVDMENNTADGSNDGPNWVDEGEAYITALQSTIHNRWRKRTSAQNVSWSTRKSQEHAAWDMILPKLVDAYLQYISPRKTSDAVPSPPNFFQDPQQAFSNTFHTFSSTPAPTDATGDVEMLGDPSSTPAQPEAIPYTLRVFNIFTLQSNITILRSQESTTAAIDLMQHGYIAKTPLQPGYAVSVETLLLLHRLRQHKASFSIESFARVICDYYAVPYRRFVRDVFADTYEVYLRILRVVDTRVSKILGRDDEDWRIKNSCPACCYELEDEPPLEIRRFIAIDGNNSLKRMKTVGQRKTADTRVLQDGVYYLPREYVDQFSNEVKGKKMKGPAVPVRNVATVPRNDEWETDSEPGGDEEEVEGDPTDGATTGDVTTDAKQKAIEACVRNWKAAASDDQKKSMWEIFDETGIFAAACRHGFVLIVVDMLRSGELAKYPLAVVSRILETHGPDVDVIYDIGCGFETTVKKSPLVGPLYLAQRGRMSVPSFHGYSHCYSCQMVFHPNVIKGMGLEDGETMERTFSGSNALASITRFASRYRRALYIETYFQQVDRDKYSALGTFILNNLLQAKEILEGEGKGLQKAMEHRSWTEEHLAKLAAEEQAFVGELRDKAPYNIHEVAYVELLDRMRQRENARATIHDRFHKSKIVPVDASLSYTEQVKINNAIETERRRIDSDVTRIHHDIIELEVTLGIRSDDRWTPLHPKYQETMKFIREKKALDALEHLQRLVILRLFELHKLNISQTGYKMRSQIANHLKKRCKAIRNAIKSYNKAADSCVPPRPQVDWDKVSNYQFIEEFELLKNTHNDVTGKEFAEPAVRETIKMWRRVERAREEIVRCGVEARRLHTAIRDEEAHFSRVLARMDRADPLYSSVQDFCARRRKINARLRVRIKQIYDVSVYPGAKGPGTRLGGSSIDAEPSDVSPEQAVVDEEDGVSEGEEDEENQEAMNLIDWTGDLTA